MEFLKNDEEVQDELEALQAILESDFNYTVNEDNIICKLNIKPTDAITNLKTNLFISLIIVLSSNYPEEACMCTIEKAQGLSISSNNKNDNVNIKINKLEDELNKVSKTCAEGQLVAIFEIHTVATEWLTDEASKQVAIQEQEQIDKDIAISMAQEELKEMALQAKMNKKELQEEKKKFDKLYQDAMNKWTHGEPIIDRKSTFQAHVAIIHSVEEGKELMRYLCTDNKIARATHNIWALRIVQPNGVVMSDNDDDGETAAGGRLMHLLDMMKVENALCVVSRWYGGILLGPARFKHINNVARKELEKYGFGGGNNSKNSAKKKKGKS